MENRIDNCFGRLRSEKRKGFIPYICAGDPNLKRTVDLAFALEKAGADLIDDTVFGLSVSWALPR